MSRTPTPAGLELLRAGLQPKTLAADLGLSPQAVSFQLAGKSARTSDALLQAITDRAGRQVAERVAKRIEESRRAREAGTQTQLTEETS